MGAWIVWTNNLGNKLSLLKEDSLNLIEVVKEDSICANNLLRFI